MHKLSISNFQNQTPFWKTSSVRETHQSREGRRQRQWQRGSSSRKETSAGSSSSLWRSFCFVLFSSLLSGDCSEAVPSTAPRGLCRPLCVDCVGLFEVLRMRCPLTSSLRRSTIPLLPEYHKYMPLFTDNFVWKNRKIIWDFLCKLKGWSQVLK